MLQFVSEGVNTYTVDFNRDGRVDGDELQIWETAFGNSTAADADGISDGFDFLAWQRQFGSGMSPQAPAQAVPEPGAMLLLVLGTLIAMSLRRG